MGKQKKICWKCGDRHYPPMGNKCDKTELYGDVNNSNGMGVDCAGFQSEKDSHDIPSTS